MAKFQTLTLKTEAGVPLAAGFHVALRTADGSYARVGALALTDAQGRATVGPLTEGTQYYLVVSHPATGPHSRVLWQTDPTGTPAFVELLLGDSEPPAPPPPVSQGYTITVYQGDTGTPLAGATIKVYKADGSGGDVLKYQGVTGASGSKSLSTTFPSGVVDFTGYYAVVTHPTLDGVYFGLDAIWRANYAVSVVLAPTLGAALATYLAATITRDSGNPTFLTDRSSPGYVNGLTMIRVILFSTDGSYTVAGSGRNFYLSSCGIGPGFPANGDYYLLVVPATPGVTFDTALGRGALVTISVSSTNFANYKGSITQVGPRLPSGGVVAPATLNVTFNISKGNIATPLAGASVVVTDANNYNAVVFSGQTPANGTVSFTVSGATIDTSGWLAQISAPGCQSVGLGLGNLGAINNTVTLTLSPN